MSPLAVVVVVDPEECACEGHHLPIGHEDTGVDLPRRAYEEGDPKEADPEDT